MEGIVCIALERGGGVEGDSMDCLRERKKGAEGSEGVRSYNSGNWRNQNCYI